MNYFETIKKYFPSIFKLGENPVLTAIIQSITDEMDNTSDIVRKAKDQIFISTAEGEYLNILGDNNGVPRPEYINLETDKYRELIPLMSYAPKQLAKTIYGVLDIFYGPEYSHSNTYTFGTEPYFFGEAHRIRQVTFTDGSPIVTGGGFLTLKEGLFVRSSADENTSFIQISSIESDDTLRLLSPYKGTSGEFELVWYEAPVLRISLDSHPEQLITLSPIYAKNLNSITSDEVINAINAGSNPALGTLIAKKEENNLKSVSRINLRTNTPGTIGSIHVLGGTANELYLLQENSKPNSIKIKATTSIKVGDFLILGSEKTKDRRVQVMSVSSDDNFTTITLNKNVEGFSISDSSYCFLEGRLGVMIKKIDINDLQLKTVIYEINNNNIIIRLPAELPSLRRKLQGSTHMKGGQAGRVISLDDTKGIAICSTDEFMRDNFFTGQRIAFGIDEYIIKGNTKTDDGYLLVTLEKDRDTTKSLTGKALTGTLKTISIANEIHQIDEMTFKDVSKLHNQELLITTPDGTPNISVFFKLKQFRLEPLPSQPNNKFCTVVIETGDAPAIIAQKIVDALGDKRGVIPSVSGDKLIIEQSVAGSCKQKNTDLFEFVTTQEGLSSKTIIGEGTSFKAEVSNRDDISIDRNFYKVVKVVNDTTLVLDREVDSDKEGVTAYNLTRLNESASFVILNDKQPGPFIFNPFEGLYNPSGVKCRLKQQINKGTVISSIQVDDSGDFSNDKNYIVINMGRMTEEQPILIRGVPNNKTILVDPSYIFRQNHYEGEIINLLAPELDSLVPRVNGNDFPSYITGTREARIVVQELIKKLKSAGVTITWLIDYIPFPFETSFDREKEI